MSATLRPRVEHPEDGRRDTVEDEGADQQPGDAANHRRKPSIGSAPWASG